jgi:1-pyrroline-5-carboxylate dehydrogenase
MSVCSAAGRVSQGGLDNFISFQVSLQRMNTATIENSILDYSARNEPILTYAPGSPERASLESTLERMAGETLDMPMFVNGNEVRTGRLDEVRMPHDHGHVLGNAHIGGEREVTAAIAAARAAWPDWSRRSWTERAGIFLRAADLLAGDWRVILNTATMLGQSKTAHQAEIDAAAELIDFFRFNVQFMLRIYAEQPRSGAGTWNRVDYRPLEGFVYAATPFNFTAIAGNLSSAPALLGNTIVWKPSATARFSAHYLMKLLMAAGLPPGVINLVYGDPKVVSAGCLASEHLAGVHFTGSTTVFNDLLRTVGERTYRSYPRIVGETGGKNFVLAHPSADVEVLATAVLRGGYEYQGQKCSAASRLFIPQSLWPRLRERLSDEIARIRVGDVRDLRNFMGAVIDERAWRKHDCAIAEARSLVSVRLEAGGSTDMREGYFVHPTLLSTTDPNVRHMTEELFGPIVCAYVYPDADYVKTIAHIDESSNYGLTGSVFSTDRNAIAQASVGLRYAAGNFYINDKPTGAVVGQQPFGGARASGTNDKAGSMWNLMRWVSPRTIKETFEPSRDYRYPFMQEHQP